MNSLSWLIYFADVAGSLKGLAFAATLLAGLGYAGFLLAGNYQSFVYDKEDGILLRLQATWSRALLILTIPLAAAFIPSSGTIYAIAASELGEDALKSETGGKAVEALNAWLDRQIAGGAEPSE